MLNAYIHVITSKNFGKKHHFQDEKCKEKIKRPIKCC
jgi:hypothetical protein